MHNNSGTESLLGIGCCILASFGSLYFVGRNPETFDSEGELYMKATSTEKTVGTFQTEVVLKPSPVADMAFSGSADITAMGQNVSLHSTPGLPDPTKCHATGKGLEEAAVGDKSTAILHIVNSDGKPCEQPDSLECELVSEISSTRTTCTLKVIGMGQYEVSYQPTIKGRHQLLIKIDDQHIKGSPFTLLAIASPDEELGTPILTIVGVEGPWGIALTKTGELIVSEEKKHRISVFSPEGKRIRSFGKYGSGKGQFENPCGVAVDIKGNILVVDHSNHRIQKFTTEGQFIKTVGTEGRGALQFYFPIDVATSNTKVYVVDKYNHRLQVLNSDLTYSHTFGRKGSNLGQFSHPLGVFHTNTGKVYVTDLDYHRVQVFTAEGKFLRMFGKNGPGWQGQMDWPNGIVIDSNGVVYVTESRVCRVSMYSSSGQFLASFGTRGEGTGEFNHPRGIAVDGSGTLYVCDRYNNRIQVF